MENSRLFFRSFDAARAVSHFNGFLPTVLHGEAVQAVCRLQAGETLSDSKMAEHLKTHQVIVELDGRFYCKVPMLTVGMAQRISEMLDEALPQSKTEGGRFIREMAAADPELWEKTGHVAVSQLIIGLLWYKMWQNLADAPGEPAAVIITDFDLNSAFFPGVYPLFGNQAVSYWQSGLLGHPDSISDILYHPNVYKSLQSTADDGGFTPVVDALVQLKQLNMYRNRTGENGMPEPYVTLPVIGASFAAACKRQLRQLAQVFYNNSNLLTDVSRRLYEARRDALRAVDYDSFRQMVYLVYSHRTVAAWQAEGLLPDENRVRDRKKPGSAVKWQLAR